ncbi:MAG TPA: hypothetical protein VFR10_11535, partial [bacterium]|nr:hypothetical protein [bacterium]
MKLHSWIRSSVAAGTVMAGATLAPLFSAVCEASPEAPLIAYSSLTPKDIEQGCTDAIAESDKILAEMIKVPDATRTFDNTMIPLGRVQDV